MKSLSSINYNLNRALKRRGKLNPKKEVEVKEVIKEKIVYRDVPAEVVKENYHNNKYAVALLFISLILTVGAFVLITYIETLYKMRLVPVTLIFGLSIMSLLFALPRITRGPKDESEVDGSAIIVRTFLLVVTIGVSIGLGVLLMNIVSTRDIKLYSVIMNLISASCFYLAIYYMWSK